MANHGVTWRHTRLDCDPTTIPETVAGLARYHDFAAVGMNPGDTTLRTTAEAIVFGSGRPTILLPEEKPPGTFDHVAIAWDGGRVATRAVGDARMFLTRAKSVTILCIRDEKPLPSPNPGHRLQDFLEQHDIHATLSAIETRGRPIAEILQDHSIAISAGLMVMGAFGHSRLREFVLGGATEGVLRDLRLPVMLSH